MRRTKSNEIPGIFVVGIESSNIEILELAIPEDSLSYLCTITSLESLLCSSTRLKR